MLQVWQHVVFIYFFYKFSFFSKNLFQQQKKISNRFEFFFFVAETNFLRKKCCATKEKYPGTLKIFSWNCNNLKNLLQFHEKVAPVLKAQRLAIKNSLEITVIKNHVPREIFFNFQHCVKYARIPVFTMELQYIPCFHWPVLSHILWSAITASKVLIILYCL